VEAAHTPSQWRSGRIRPQLFLIVVAVMCGLAAAAGAVIFRVLIAWVQSLAFAPHPLAVSLADVLHQALGHERPSFTPPGFDLAWWRRLPLTDRAPTMYRP